jgi:CubicO group peptidase (beta-lactamase class C family)
MPHHPLVFDRARAILRDGLEMRAFPAAAVDVGRSDASLWSEAFGRLTYDADARPAGAETIFDLASLTKVIATASIAMQQVQSGRLPLDARVSSLLPLWTGADRRRVTVRQLFDHSSGLPGHLRLWTELSGREAYERRLCEASLDRPPGTSAVYSDPGFILLGLLLEKIGDATLDAQMRSWLGDLSETLRFTPPVDWVPNTAPTEQDDWRGRLLVGEVHDENAAAIGGVAGHAGLFGTAEAVGTFARLVLQTFKRQTRLGTPELMREFAARSRVPGSSRALGWDTMLTTSSCGTRMSSRAIGHTGFTGTSLWVDPERDMYAVLLTNRVHPSRTNEKFLPLRARFHDALPF